MGPLATFLLLLTACGPGPSDPGGAPSASVAADESPAGVLVCAEPYADFGRVWQGAVLEHEFLLEARGSQAFTLSEVTADCGCTVASLELSRAGAPREPHEPGEPIEPGDRLFLSVRYDTAGKFDDAPRTVWLVGPAPVGRVEVAVRADVRPWLFVSPQRVDLLPQTEDEVTEAVFRVTSSDRAPFALEHVPLGVPDQLVVALVPEAADADGRAAAWTARVTLGPELPRGPHGYPIQLQADVPNTAATPGEDGQHPLHRAFGFVGVNVVGPVSLAPPTLLLGMVPAAEVSARTVRVVCHDPDFELPEPVARLEPLKPDEDFALARTARISTRAVPGENAWDVQLLLEGLDPAVPRSILARLVIETGHPGEPLLEAPITGYNRDGVR